MHKRYLWIDRRGADVYWPALGNVDISATGKGTLAYWARLLAGGHTWWNNTKNWRVWVSESNYMASNWGRSVIVVSDGTVYCHSVGDIDRVNMDWTWELHVTTWDFSSGVVKSYYNDAQPVNDPLTGVPAPLGSPSEIVLGSTYDGSLGEDVRNVFFYCLGIWDEEMSEEQIAALYDPGHRRTFQPGDGPGNLTLLLAFDNGLDADVAAGDGSWDQAEGASADRFCLLEDGIRKLGHASYPLGMPRHDGSEDDRKPLNAVCPLLLSYGPQIASTSDVNETNYSKLIVSGHNSTQDAGAAFPDIPKPATYRQFIHIPTDAVPAGYEMGIGPVAYKFYPAASTGVFDQLGSGRQFQVLADGGNTASSFRSNIGGSGWSGDNYWVGALLILYTGNCAGRSLFVTAYDDTTKFITLEGSLPATPDAGSYGFVNFYPRIMGQDPTGVHPGTRLPEYTLEANLWAHHEGSKHFVELEWQHPQGKMGAVALLRYERGRSVGMAGCPRYHGSTNSGACYGKWMGDDGYYDQPGGTNLEIWLRKIEIDGPGQYQILRKDATARGPALADNFVILTRDRAGIAGDSVKVWQQRNLTFQKQKPTKISDWEAVVSDLEASGTWREKVKEPGGTPLPVEYDEGTETITAVIVGTDAADVRRLGYVRGQWDDQTGRISWEDEPAPPGKSNPVLETGSVHADYEQDAPGGLDQVAGLLPSIDGTWSLIYYSGRDAMDGTRLFALHGASDRWSFDHATQFADQAITLHGGVDMRNPLTGHGMQQWGNAHLYGAVLKNLYAQETRAQYIGLFSAKSILNDRQYYSADPRPLCGVVGADVKSLVSLPYGGSSSPLVGPFAHGIDATILGQEDAIAALIEYTSGFTAGIGLYTSEDGVHFQELFPTGASGAEFIPQNELPGEGTRLGPQSSFRLGDKRIYYYNFGEDFNFAWCRNNGETWYALSDAETEGFLETPILEEPAEGWGELYLNVELNEGQVRVQVIDAETELSVAGYDVEDCDDISSGLEHQVSWGAAGFSELTSDYLRLRLYLSRNQAEDDSAQLFAWEIKPPVVRYPWVSGLLVEGQVNPTNVADATPSLSWTYHHPENSTQSAYQIIVASSAELLEQNIGDIDDSGVVLSSETSTVYDGTALQDYETYFWKVRVRSAEGVWSEQW